MDLTKKTFDFLSILTGVVGLFYLTAWAFALATGQAPFEAFSKELDPRCRPAGWLLGKGGSEMRKPLAALRFLDGLPL